MNKVGGRRGSEAAGQATTIATNAVVLLELHWASNHLAFLQAINSSNQKQHRKRLLFFLPSSLRAHAGEMKCMLLHVRSTSHEHSTASEVTPSHRSGQHFCSTLRLRLCVL